jgi:predicted Zn-dependent protease
MTNHTPASAVRVPVFHAPVVRLLTILVALPLLAACATNPVTGKTELSLIPESQEIAMGQEAAGQIAAQMGLVQDQALQTYVSDLGLALAKNSERPHLPWKFHVVDDAVVNAFALPGGFIFITRGILTHMNSEAELASVLGHEIGHVTAKHSVSQISKAQLAQIGLGIGSLMLPEGFEGLGDIAGAGLGLLFLKFGRDDERQSDELGFRYMTSLGYDPREMASMFRTLERQAKTQGSSGIPEWASTHPAPENRVASTLARVDKLASNPDELKVGRDEFLGHLAGIVFGENPRHGYFKGDRFYHPDLAFQFDFPKGWTKINRTDAVIGVSPAQDAVVQLRLAGKKTPREHADEFFAKEGIEAGRSTTDPINGLTAWRGYFRATTTNGVLAGLLGWIAHGENTYQIASFTTEPKLETFGNAFVDVTKSFRRVSDRAVLAVKPATMSLVRADRDMTLAEFNGRYPSSIPLGDLALINGLEQNETIRKGRMVKRVQGGELP